MLGILLVTSEWSQRTVLTTSTLVPRRGQIVLARAGAAVLLSLAVVAATVVLAGAGNLAAQHVDGADGSWAVSAAAVGGAVLLQIVNVAVGFGFGLMLLSSPLAIVLYFALPTVLSIVAGLVPCSRTSPSGSI